MQLSSHFEQSEFEKDGPMPPEVVPAYTTLCANILEPIRSRVGGPIVITSGYRNAAANAAAGGVQHSEHDATANYCAADFCTPGVTDIKPLFDWIRTNPHLPFHQVILESDPKTAAQIIHVSWNNSRTDREALVGETANQSAYTSLPVVAYQPLESAVDEVDL